MRWGGEGAGLEDGGVGRWRDAVFRPSTPPHRKEVRAEPAVAKLGRRMETRGKEKKRPKKKLGNAHGAGVRGSRVGGGGEGKGGGGGPRGLFD